MKNCLDERQYSLMRIVSASSGVIDGSTAHIFFFEQADEYSAGVLVKRGRGRPPGAKKAQMNLRIDLDVIEAYKAQGEGWQTRMDQALREWAQSHGLMPKAA